MSDYIALADTVEDSDYINNGIFTYIKNSYTTPPEWLEDIGAVNVGYYLLHSGNKIISPFITKQINASNVLSRDACYQVARVILAMYKDNWDKLYNAMTVDYSPIENVDEYLTETTDTTGNLKTSGSGTDTGTDTHTKTGTDTTTNTGTDTMKIDGTENTANTGTDTMKIDGTENTANTGTDTTATSGTDTVTSDGTDDLKKTGSDTTRHTINETVKDSGTDTHDTTSTDTTTHSGTDKTTDTGTDTNKNENKNGTSEVKDLIYGYNSEQSAPDKVSTTTVNQTVTNTETRDLAGSTQYGHKIVDSVTGQNTDTYGKTESTTGSDVDTVEYGSDDDRTTHSTEATQYGKEDTRTLDTQEATTTDRTEQRTLDTQADTSTDRTEKRTLDTSEATQYNNSDTETVNLSHATTGSEDRTGKEEHTLHRHGNVGVTTNQHMINEEWELRKKVFLEHVYSDVDRLMTLPIY